MVFLWLVYKDTNKGKLQMRMMLGQLSFSTDTFYCNYYFWKTGIRCKSQSYWSSEDVLHSCSEIFEEMVSFYVFALKLKSAGEEWYCVLRWCICNAFQFLSVASLHIFFKLCIYKEELFGNQSHVFMKRIAWHPEYLMMHLFNT